KQAFTARAAWRFIIICKKKNRNRRKKSGWKNLCRKTLLQIRLKLEFLLKKRLPRRKFKLKPPRLKNPMLPIRNSLFPNGFRCPRPDRDPKKKCQAKRILNFS